MTDSAGPREAAIGTPTAGSNPQSHDEPPPDGTLQADDGHPSGAGLEIGSSGMSPVIEEAAILYANGQVEGAADVLAEAVREDRLGSATLQAWLMLLDLYQYLGHEKGFEALALAYATRFESSPPAWQDEDVARPAVDDRSNAARVGVVLPAAVDAGVARQVDAIERAVQRERDVTIDCRGVRAVDAAGAALLDAALARLERGTRQAVLVAPERLLDAARAAVQTGRRDADPGAWLLWLRLLRLMGTQGGFDDASIEYCITYEVSPPPWEPMPAHVRRDEAGPAASGNVPQPAGGASGAAAGATAPDGAAPDAPAPRADAFVLCGEIVGTMQAEAAALRAHAARHAHVFIDCRRLKRLDFAAAGELLNVVAGLRADGRTVEFDQPNHAVAALLMVMGLQETATITPRRR